MSTIPASTYVRVLPGVIQAGGQAIDLNGLVLTNSTRVPIGQALSFGGSQAVANYFGAASKEAQIAGGGVGLGTGYFGGFAGCTSLPGALLFVQYNQAAVAAWLQGGNVAGLTLAQLQALSGSLTAVMDGYSHVISSINLSTASSFSAAAAAIQAAFTDPTEASFTGSIGASFTATATGTSLAVTAVTGYISIGDVLTATGIPAGTYIVSQNTGGTPGGAGTYITSVSTTASTASVTSTSNVVDVTVCASPTIAVGQTLAGGSVTGTPVILTQVSGTAGGVGLYTFSGAQQSSASGSLTSKATAPVVTYDSVSGAFIITSGITGVPSTAAYATGTLAASLALTLATGAVLSQGAAGTTPAALMAAIINITTNWATFMTSFDPDGGSGFVNKLAFAAWVNGTNDRYAYIAWDTDVSPRATKPATGSFGYAIQQGNYSGTVLISELTDLNLAAFVMGVAASLDFTATNGRNTLAYRSQPGLLASVTDQQTAYNLGGNPFTPSDFGNGYNYYAAIATAALQFTNMQRGMISGPYLWFDSYINQIWMNANFQLDLLELLIGVGSVPYNPVGYAMIEASLQDTITGALNFGAIRAGVVLTAIEIIEVNNAAGANVAPILQNRGWYLQVLDPGGIVRQSRGTPDCNFWYTDGESVQAISLTSVAVL